MNDGEGGELLSVQLFWVRVCVFVCVVFMVRCSVLSCAVVLVCIVSFLLFWSPVMS